MRVCKQIKQSPESWIASTLWIYATRLAEGLPEGSVVTWALSIQIYCPALK